MIDRVLYQFRPIIFEMIPCLKPIHARLDDFVDMLNAQGPTEHDFLGFKFFKIEFVGKKIKTFCVPSELYRQS